MPMFIDGKEVKKIVVNGTETLSAYYRKEEAPYSLVFERDPAWMEYDKADPFQDSTCVAMFAFEDNFSDAKNVYTFTNSGATIDTTDSKFSKCLKITTGASLTLSSFNIPGAFTIMFLMNATSFPARNSWIFQFGSNHGFTSAINSSKNFSFHNPGTVELRDENATYMADDKWVFVSLVVKGLSVSDANMRWYRNGVYKPSLISGGGAMPPISMLNIAPSKNFNGKIKDLRIFNREVTVAEMATLMAAEGIV